MTTLANLSLVALANLYNNAIDEHSLPAGKLVKFKDRAQAEKRIATLLEEHNMYIPEGVMRILPVAVETDVDDVTQEYDTVAQEADTVEEQDAEELIEELDDEPEQGTEQTQDAGEAPRKPRRARVGHVPKAADEILSCRANTNQSLLIDVMFKGTTLGAAVRHVNATLSKNLSKEVIHAIMVFTLCKVKGYGVRVEPMNGQQLYDLEMYVDAAELGVSNKGTTDSYDPEVTRPVYRLVLPEGMTTPKPHTVRKVKAPKAAEAQAA